MTGHAIKDQPYDNLEDSEDCRKWLTQALELREPKQNYRILDLDLEELETLYWDKPSAKIDGASRVDVGIYLGSTKVLERDKASASRQTSTPPSPARPTISSQKLVSASKGSHPTAKVSKARIAELQNSDTNSHLRATNKRKAQEVRSSEHETAAPLQPATTKRRRPPESSSRAPRPAAPPQVASVDINPEPRPSPPPVVDQHGSSPEPNAANEPQVPVRKRKQSTKKLEARLNEFGPARLIVLLALELMYIEMLVDQPFPDIVEDDQDPDESDDDIGRAGLKLFDRWAVEFYDKAHRILRRNQSAVLQEDRHKTYMSYQLSQLRYQIKKAAYSKIALTYSLQRGDPGSVARATNLLYEDQFLSPNFANDGYQFTIDIIKETIQEALFNGPKDLGSRYSDCFYPMMPRATIALTASIIRHGIKSFTVLRATKQSLSLEAGEDHTHFMRYINLMASMPGKNLKNRLENTQRDILKSCMLSSSSESEVPETVIAVQERDSEKDTELEQELKELARKKNAGKQRRISSLKNAKGKQRERNPTPGPSGLHHGS
ncbi:hypothetical protein FRC10_006968 [Ceratobasidium sp. 414]|nr:hypothetical protein FRC10_006968 [Ceratobasidium sp. 414]